MPLRETEVDETRHRVWAMFLETIRSFEAIADNAEMLFGDRGPQVQAAIAEYIRDFLQEPQASGMKHPEESIFRASRLKLQKAGFYGVQLDIKERQVLEANRSLRERLAQGALQLWRRPFRKWVDIINNFLGSLGAAAGVGEALKELKDCLRDELPDGDE